MELKRNQISWLSRPRDFLIARWLRVCNKTATVNHFLSKTCYYHVKTSAATYTVESSMHRTQDVYTQKLVFFPHHSCPPENRDSDPWYQPASRPQPGVSIYKCLQIVEFQFLVFSSSLLCFCTRTASTMVQHLFSQWVCYCALWNTSLYEILPWKNWWRLPWKSRVACFWYVSFGISII